MPNTAWRSKLTRWGCMRARSSTPRLAVLRSQAPRGDTSVVDGNEYGKVEEGCKDGCRDCAERSAPSYITSIANTVRGRVTREQKNERQLEWSTWSLRASGLCKITCGNLCKREQTEKAGKIKASKLQRFSCGRTLFFDALFH
jgi:hypothetical protein